jgi:predicted 2-oxoglutarate/Fe(II)-dependent dioxygenase YbiX
MVTAARDRLARTLRGDVKSASSVEVTTPADDLSLTVAGFGRVQFPVTPAKARKLIGLGQPARFGRGTETLTDPDVRDTWEIPKHLVSTAWLDSSLEDILATAKEELGLPHGAKLTADLHSLLVYEPGQFFLAHQDSEKDDSMIGTLVVTLPSNYTGGELMVGRGEEWKAYRGSKKALSAVAFYADCRHEVLKVKSGYRVTLTYNLLVHGDAGRTDGNEATIAELADLLREHFSTAAPRYHYGPATDIPKRLVYLLDHEYTPRGLGWGRLKGADASRVALLRAAADNAGCEPILALADIKTQYSAFSSGDDREYRSWDDSYDDDYDEDGLSSGSSDVEYEIQELIDSEIALTHWAGPDGGRLEETSLRVGVGEVCASTPTDELTPRESEYEGYMGNWGNTLDRWYHRAAVVIWPRAQAFANRAETSPAWALEQLTAKAAAGDVSGVQAAAAALAPFWETAVRGRTSAEKDGNSGLFDRSLRAADAVADAQTAAMLLRPFRVENLTAASASSFAQVIGRYGQRWTGDLIRAWFGPDQPAWAPGGRDRPQWVTDSLPALFETLRAVGEVSSGGAFCGGGTVAAQHLLDLAWAWAQQEIRSGLASTSVSHRDRQLADLGKPLASLLWAAAAIGAASTRDALCGYVSKQDDAVTTLEVSALRAAVGLLPAEAALRTDAGFGELAADCARRLRSRLSRPYRDHDDWSIALPGDCACDLCRPLRGFLADPVRRVFEWPLAKERRHHVHSRIDGAELPVTHVTRRQGRPFTLVLTKTDELFTRDLRSRASATADLEWLAAEWPPGRTAH